MENPIKTIKEKILPKNKEQQEQSAYVDPNKLNYKEESSEKETPREEVEQVQENNSNVDVINQILVNYGQRIQQLEAAIFRLRNI